MRGPSYRRFTIAANTPKLEVDNRFPLKKYYRAADNLLKQAQIYREEKNLIELYVLLLRFSSLVGETIPKHRDFRAYPSKEKAVYTQKFVQILSELEKLKPEVQRQVDLLNKEIENSISSDVIKDEQTYEWPPVSKSLVHSNFGARKLEIEKWKSQGNTTEHIEHLDNFSLKFPPPNKETLSRHSLLGPDGLRPRWKPPVTLARVEYPSYGDPVADLARLDQEWSTTLASETSPDLTQSVTKLEGDACPIGFGNNFDVDVCSQPNLIKQPSPPPVSAPVHDIPVMDELMQLCKPDKSLPDSLKTTDPSPSPLSTLVKDLEASDSPKKLHISVKMMDEFMRLARKNTKNNIETCAVLAGSLKNATFSVTALIIPKQQATSNTCQTENEEEIFEWQDKQGLFQLGWIHTHPTQACFMSSVDLHTHYSYQVLLPEAIAIVMSPMDNRRKYGIFRLSDPGGVRTIQKCPLRGFHAHDPPVDGSQIYEHCSHVILSTDLKFQVADLR